MQQPWAVHMYSEALSIFVGVLTLVIVCGGLWLYFRLKLHRPYLGPDPRASRRRMTYETTKISSHGFPVGALRSVDYPIDDDIDVERGE